MNIKRLLFAAIMALSFILSSCSFGKPWRYIRDDNKTADTRFQKIIEALEKKDKEGLKKMFSPKALKEAKDIDGGIEYLMNFYKGKIISKDPAISSSDSKNDGEKKIELDCMYIVTTDKGTYLVFFTL